jgi:GTPase KRas protein
MLVYNITSRQSYEELRTIRREILEVKDTDYWPMIVVGHHFETDREREVSVEDGTSLACEFGCKSIEVSSLNRVNVDEAFYELVREIKRFKKEELATRVDSVLAPNRGKQRKKWFSRSGPDAALNVDK